jgi:hypothetical protein
MATCSATAHISGRNAVAKRPATSFASADGRPRVHLRIRGETVEYAAIGCGPWTPTTDIIAAIDAIGGEDAYLSPAVIIWCGATNEGTN